MKVEGMTSFQMTLTIDSKPILFIVNSLVIKDLTDQINIGSYFLKEHEVSLKFSNKNPLMQNFKKFGTLQSVGSLNNKILPEISESPKNSEIQNCNISDTCLNMLKVLIAHHFPI